MSLEVKQALKQARELFALNFLDVSIVPIRPSDLVKHVCYFHSCSLSDQKKQESLVKYEFPKEPQLGCAPPRIVDEK